LHCPIAIPSNSAAGIEKTRATPGFAGQSRGPPQKLLLMLRKNIVEDRPGIAEAIGRPLMRAGVVSGVWFACSQNDPSFIN
jgi:hypothetical protein